MSLKGLEIAILHTVSPFIASESMLNGVKTPSIRFVDKIETPFTKEPINGLYDRNVPAIILNRDQISRLLDMGVYGDEIKLLVIETCFHEFKHHIDATKFNMTPEAYSSNKSKWERRACRYAAGMMGKYNLRAGWDESFGEARFKELKAQWNLAQLGV